MSQQEKAYVIKCNDRIIEIYKEEDNAINALSDFLDTVPGTVKNTDPKCALVMLERGPFQYYRIEEYPLK